MDTGQAAADPIADLTGCTVTKNVAGGRDPWGGCFPGPKNTGVPTGTTLTDYSGSSGLSGAITGMWLSGDFAVSGSATITNSEIDGTIRTVGSGTLTMSDVTVVGSSDESFTAISGENITGQRLNVSSGKAGLQCAGNCTLTDSWLHDPHIIGDAHYDAIGSNGATGLVLRHNTVSCTNDSIAAGATGGCSADAGFFGDSGPINRVTLDRNLFVASNDSAGYCVITNAVKSIKRYPFGSGLVYTNNVWQKGANGRCGQYGPIDAWYAGHGNVWAGNTWDDGTVLNP